MKTEKIRKFGNLTAVCSWYRNSSGTSEVVELLKDGHHCLGLGKYHWINRPWQRYDYEMALDDALDDLLDTISWKTYEEMKPDIDEVRKALGKMKDYNRSNWN